MAIGDSNKAVTIVGIFLIVSFFFLPELYKVIFGEIRDRVTESGIVSNEWTLKNPLESKQNTQSKEVLSQLKGEQAAETKSSSRLEVLKKVAEESRVSGTSTLRKEGMRVKASVSPLRLDGLGQTQIDSLVALARNYESNSQLNFNGLDIRDFQTASFLASAEASQSSTLRALERLEYATQFEGVRRALKSYYDAMTLVLSNPENYFNGEQLALILRAVEFNVLSAFEEQGANADTVRAIWESERLFIPWEKFQASVAGIKPKLPPQRELDPNIPRVRLTRVKLFDSGGRYGVKIEGYYTNFPLNTFVARRTLQGRSETLNHQLQFREFEDRKLDIQKFWIVSRDATGVFEIFAEGRGSTSGKNLSLTRKYLFLRRQPKVVRTRRSGSLPEKVLLWNENRT